MYWRVHVLFIIACVLMARINSIDLVWTGIRVRVTRVWQKIIRGLRFITVVVEPGIAGGKVYHWVKGTCRTVEL